VLTQFAKVPVHIENYKNREELIREKRYLVEALRGDGLFIYNADCEDSIKMVSLCKNETRTFGFRYGDYLAGTILNDIYEGKVVANLSIMKETNLKLELPGVLGEAAIICALPAVIIGDLFGIKHDEILSRLAQLKREPGRMRVLQGIKDSYIIDDSYNSSPLAVESGLRALKSIGSKHRKIMILGDMLELGEYTSDEHIRIGELAKSSGDILVTVGGRSRLTAASAKDSGMRDGFVLECKNSVDAGIAVSEIVHQGDIIYIKGSQGMRMEKATAMLVNPSLDFKSSIPRQDKYWTDQ
jgi:UDP-N-acetylmuramoyl-tripeptide--D-alanyl-D-alanine ligase